MTANDLITSALVVTREISIGDTPDAATMQIGLRVLNSMVSSWNTEPLMIFNINRQTFTLINGQSTYTLGPGGDFNIPRPEAIEHYGIIDSSVTPTQPLEYSLESLSDEQWADVLIKAVDGLIPTKVWDNRNYPQRTLSFFPHISKTGMQLVLHMWSPLLAFPSLLTNYNLPLGYDEALKYNLAVRLATEGFGAMPTPFLLQLAMESKANIAKRNLQPTYMACDKAATGHKQHHDGSLYRLILGF